MPFLGLKLFKKTSICLRKESELIMLKKLRLILVASTVASLLGCGGGGGGGTPAATVPVASTTTFQIRLANANATQQTSTLPFTVAGTINGVAVIGSGSVTRGNITSTAFETQTALQKVITTSGTYTKNGTTVPLSTVSTSYTDANYLPLGSYSDAEYAVVQGTANIPVTAQINDTGIVYTAIRYTNSSKTSTIGTMTATFTLLPDTANTALLRVIRVYKDNGSIVTKTTTSLTRLTPAGTSTYVSDSSTDSNGNNLTLTY
jgi:hypothetical protein